MSETTNGDLAERNRRTLERLNAGEAAAAGIQEHSLRINVDDAWSEYRKRGTAIAFTFEGREYLVPRLMSTRVAIYIAEHCSKVDEKTKKTAFEIPDDRFREALVLLLGADFANAVAASEAPWALVNATIVMPLLAHWGLMTIEGAPEKKSPSIPAPSPGSSVS